MSATAACLPCPVCAHSGVFESVESLRDRLIYVSTNKMFCPVCQEEISGLDKLTIHLFSHVKMLSNKIYSEKTDAVKNNNKTENQSASSLQEKQAKCVVAKNKSASSTAVAPMKYVKIYPKLPTISLKAIPIVEVSNSHVDNCGQSISTVAFKAETIINSTNNICDICGLQFVDSDILRMHKGLIHNIDEISNNNFSRYECHLCPKYFKMRGSLMVHLRVAHFGFLSGNCGSEYTNDGQEKKMTNDGSGDQYITLQRNDNKQWQCDVCRKCFTTKYFLKKHKRLHTGETPYACSQCNKTFTFQQSYHKHLLYHNDEKPHTCSYCGRAFKELSTLHNHQRIHTGEKPFSCETCGKCFRQRVSYLVHRRIHTGVMPYKCTACEKSFRYKVSQRTHKCLAKPPGTVVRQSGNLVEKLKKKNKVPDIDNEDANLGQKKDNKPEASFVEVSEANAELVRTGAKLSLEDMESENFTLLAENLVNTGGNSEDFRSKPCSSKVFNATQVIHNKVSAIDSNLDELIESIPCIDKNMPSPSEILKNLCLSKDDDYMAILQNQENEKQFDLYNDLGALL